MLEQFDPLRHKRGVEILEVRSIEVDDFIEDRVVPSAASYEDASRTPWFFFVEVDRG